MHTVPFAKQEIESFLAGPDSLGYLLDLIFAKINVADQELLDPFRRKN